MLKLIAGGIEVADVHHVDARPQPARHQRAPPAAKLVGQRTRHLEVVGVVAGNVGGVGGQESIHENVYAHRGGGGELVMGWGDDSAAQ